MYMYVFHTHSFKTGKSEFSGTCTYMYKTCKLYKSDVTKSKLEHIDWVVLKFIFVVVF